jgi:hypothetical protein
MTKDDIIRMAREAGLTHGQHWNKGRMTTAFMRDFAALVAAAEREACAAICEEEEELRDHTPFDAALRIRARGENT